MITVCPSCATHDTLPARHAGGDSLVRSCRSCGHEWVEGTALQIIDLRASSTAMVPVAAGPDVDAEASRLAEAARLAAERHREERQRRRATLRGWAILAAAVLVPLAGAAAFPESVTRAAPAAARLYSLAGVEVNVFGFAIRDAESELQVDRGSALLAVRGEVVNITDQAQKVPALHFVLRDGRGSETYAWTLEGGGTRQLEPGQATSFLTRIAAPPVQVQEVEIRFARGNRSP